MKPRTTALLPARPPWGRILLLVALGVCTWALLLAWFGGAETLRAMAAAEGLWLAAALLLHYSSFAVRGHRWSLLLKLLGYPLSFLNATGLLVAGWFLSALLPARAGDFARIGVLRLGGRTHSPTPVAVGMGSIVLERALDMAAIVALGALFGGAVLRTEAPGWLLASYAVALGVLAALAGGLLLAPAATGWLRRWSQAIFWQKTVDFAGQLAASLQILARQPRQAAVIVGESLAIWLSDAIVVWLVLRSVGANYSFEQSAFVALTVDVLSSIPLTPGGIGQSEAAYVAMFALLPTVPAANLGAAILLVRAIHYWSFLVFSGVITAATGFGELLQRVRLESVPPPGAAPGAAPGASQGSPGPSA